MIAEEPSVEALRKTEDNLDIQPGEKPSAWIKRVRRAAKKK